MGDPELRKRVQQEVERLTGCSATAGMANVKAFFKELSRTVAFVERGGDPRVLQTSLNLRLTGNPGMLGWETHVARTGKTTVARLIGRYLYAHGVLPRDTFVERNALALKGLQMGDAMGGCLFIDEAGLTVTEAYALADRGGDKFSGEVIRTLLTEVMNSYSGEHAAQDRFNLTFAPGLVEALAQHIKSQHGQEISQHNGGAMD
eukprot:Skav203294  [mRNA]  locus=scaffold2189:17741:20127:- [translate_table: standard]